MNEQNPYDSPARHADERRDRNTKAVGMVSAVIAVVLVVLLAVAGAVSFWLLNVPMEVPNAQVGPIVETSPPVPMEQEAPNSPEPSPSTESDSPVTE